MTELEIKKLLTTLGLCAKARKLVYGTEQICDALREGKTVCLVLEASDTSPNTHKRLTDRTAYYRVRHVRIEADTVEPRVTIQKLAYFVLCFFVFKIVTPPTSRCTKAL